MRSIFNSYFKSVAKNIFCQINIITIMIILLGLISFGQSLKAEPAFLDSGSGLFADHKGKLYTVVSYTPDSEGIFFTILKKPVGIQNFNPSKITKDSFHFFISYSPTSNNYTNLIIGNKIYKITGSFTLEIGNHRLGLDATSNFLTVTVDDNRVLGFRGLQPVVNTTLSSENAFLVEANLSTSLYRDLIKPYVLERKNGTQVLSLSGKPVLDSFIGLTIRRAPNVCLDREPILLTRADIATISKLKNNKQRQTFLTQAITKNAEKGPFNNDYILLQAASENLVYYNIERASILILTPMKSNFGDKTVCILSKENPI
jgi:hypothetical protein